MKNFDEIEKDAVDFFKNPAINKDSPKPIKIWAMGLYTFHNTFKYLSKFTVGIAIALLVVGSITGVTKAITQHSDEKSLVAQKQAQSEQTNKINMIKNIDPKRFVEIIQYIDKSRIHEEQKIAQIYWSARYVNIESEQKFNMTDIGKTARTSMQNAENFYTSRKRELTSTYDFIKSGHRELISPTFDNADPLDKILVWDSLLKTQTFETSYANELENNLDNVLGMLKYPEKLQTYLDGKKSFIDNPQVY